MAYIKFENVTKNYIYDEIEIKAIKKINFEIEKGEFIVILGPLESGKTTLLNLLGTLDKVTSGNIFIDDVDITNEKRKKISKYRKYNIGFAYKDSSLIKNLSVKENVELAKQVCKEKEDVSLILKKCGLTKKADYYPSMLSEEDKCRTLVAMALIKNPKILLLDEIVDSLDEKCAKQILKAIKSISKKNKMTVIITTKNNNFIKIANKVITLKNGSLSDLAVNKKIKSIGDISWWKKRTL